MWFEKCTSFRITKRWDTNTNITFSYIINDAIIYNKFYCVSKCNVREVYVYRVEGVTNDGNFRVISQKIMGIQCCKGKNEFNTNQRIDFQEWEKLLQCAWLLGEGQHCCQ